MRFEHFLFAESAVMNLLNKLGMPVPRVYETDVSKKKYPFMWQIMEFVRYPNLNKFHKAGTLVSAMRYPPEGMRGLTGSSRASSYGAGFKDYFRNANGSLRCIAQIETAEAVEHVDSIAAVSGIDVLFMGHSDLSLNRGCYNDFENGKMRSAEKALIEACAKHGKTAGMLMKSGMKPDDCVQKGFRFLALGTDHSAMKQAFMSMLQNS